MRKRFVFRGCFLALGACAAYTLFLTGCGSSGGKEASSPTGGQTSGGGSVAAGGTSGSGNGLGGAAGALVRPPDPCVLGGCPPGVWVDVTPPGVDLVNGACGNYGTKSVQADPRHPQDLYTLFFCQGVWKSSDYGQTWKGPINTGASGSVFGDCAGGITIPPNSASDSPTLYASCIRGAGLGFWRSTNGGVDWTHLTTPDGSGQQYYPPTVDPYDPKHLLMPGHGVDFLIESSDGGDTWNVIKTDPGMAQAGGTGEIAFIDNGDPAATRKTWLWLGAASGGKVGTWRSADAGATWTKVETNEHINGSTQVYQPDTKGVIFMAGVYSALGWGVLRSEDYGKTWAHVGLTAQETVVFGTSRFLYALYGWGQPADVTLEVSPLPGTGTWTSPGTPAAMTLGPAQAAVTNDGTANIVVLANFNGGVWRYLEPTQ